MAAASLISAAVIKLSLCPCGFPVLETAIKVGTIYEVKRQSCGSGTLICGGCGKHIAIEVVFVCQRGESHGGYMPKEIFDL